ncbi:putative cross-wall-targeting lipoprotein signal domain-containing proteiin [Streptococcus marmotae]|nr:putative cross-wall-targeting lipoprotein signal domain-containing proteiin [Streptococcus marmotae]
MTEPKESSFSCQSIKIGKSVFRKSKKYRLHCSVALGTVVTDFVACVPSE